MTHTEGGVVLSAVMLVYCFTSIPAGMFVDKVGIRKAMAVALLGIAVFGLLRAFSVNYLSLVVFTVGLGIFCTIISPAIPKIAAVWFPPKELGMAIGIMTTAFMAGSAVAVMSVNSIIIPLVGDWRGVFISVGIVGFVIAAIWWTFARESTGLRVTGSLSEATEEVSLVQKLLIVLRNKYVWILSLMGVSFFGFQHGITQWLPYFFEDAGQVPVMAGFIASVMSWATLVSAALLPMISDRIGLRRPVLIVAAISAACAAYALTIFTQGIGLWVVSASIGIFLGGIFPLSLVVLVEQREIGQGLAGSGTGVIHSVGHFGGFLVPVLMGYIKDVTGSFFFGILLNVVVIIIIVPLAFLLEETGARGKRSSLPK